MKKIKMGIVGCGGVFKHAHLPAFEKIGNVEIVAVCRGNNDKNFDEGFLPTAKRYKTWQELICDPEIDAIDICAPNYLHSIVAVAALKKGLHVLTEKPDAISVAEMRKIMREEKENGKVFMAMRNNRYLNVSQFFKKYIADGKAGQIYCGRCGIIRQRGIPGKGGWFTTKALSGGGPLIDLGVHMIDLALYLMGNPKVVSVSGCTYNKFSENEIAKAFVSRFGEKKENGTFDVEDLAIGFIRFENGACIQVEFSWASNIEKDDFFLELRGEKSGIKFSSCGNRIFTEENGRLVALKPEITENEGGHVRNIAHFINVIQGKEKPDYTSEQGRHEIEIIEALYKSAATGKEVRI